jgi:4-hydroxybenzoyl-CoA reductase subunit beta
MMRLPPFTYLAPRRLEEAVRLLADHGAEATVVAGGTDLYPNMKRRQMEPRVLVGIRGIRELRGIQGTGRDGLVLGAATTLTEVADHPAVRAAHPAVARAAALVSTPQLRNMGTIGGNVCVDTRCNYYNQTYEWRKAIGFCMKKDGNICLVAPGSARCWAVSSSDTAPVFWALGATVTLVGPSGERRVPVSALYRDDGIQYLGKAGDEIVTAIHLPPADGWRATYWKLRRRGSIDFPVLGVAVAARFEDAICRDARVVLGAVASAPREASEAARALVGARWTPDVIARAGDAAARPAKPLDNTDLVYHYRKRMTRVYVERALREIAGLPPEGLWPSGMAGRRGDEAPHLRVGPEPVEGAGGGR